MQLKACTKCGIEKPLDAEHFPTRYGGKFQSWCRVCTREAGAKHFAQVREYEPERVMLANAKARAKRKGVPFSITLDDIELPDVCPVLGIELSYTNDRGFMESSPSLDRIKPELGYVPGNVWVISLRANRIKNDSSIEELKLLIAALEGVLR